MEDNWATFVMNRVMEIRSLSETEDWHRVPGCLNPADLPSRGCLADSLERSKWWEGPSWLRRPRRDWPHREIYPDPDIVNSEKRKIVLTSTCIEREKDQYYYRFSNYYKILRVTAWMNRFLTNARGTIGQRVKGDLTVNKIKRAELMLVRVIQRESFTGPEDKRLKGFKLCCDSLGLLRVKTKISRRQDLERLIGLLKQLLRKILGQARLEFEELYTIICDTESLMNSRPLTPALFLHDLKEIGVPDLDSIERASLQKRYRFRQRLREDLRKRFRTEYFGFLRQETRRRSKTRPIKVGDLVLIGQDNAKRVNWPLARVVEVYPGRDGPVRVAKLRTSKGVQIRPVQRLYNLEIPADLGSTLRSIQSEPRRGGSRGEARTEGRKKATPSPCGVPRDIFIDDPCKQDRFWQGISRCSKVWPSAGGFCLRHSLSPCLGDKHPSLCHGLYLCPVGCPRSLSVLTSSPASASCCPRVGRTSTLASRTRLPAYPYVGRITFETILQKVERITEDSGMQRMTEAPVVNCAFVWMLLLLVFHLDDPVDHLKDAMRGLAVPRIEQVITAPIDSSCATNIFFHRLEQADKIHREILALPRQKASTMSHGNHRKKDHQASSQLTSQDPFKTSIW
ncbi:hypothetical protein LAZ67_16002215 [Cordylochernes scorpioides]|uniref:DUF5641 domain-containing protein n=1 Tax=Cordylochernes scorpioides TaxID=51811 RepID=A0ABY6LBT1_9ARAC|nr:hypothetical protein LAZ67_16002215 [Cordylochernes scorpioides]